MLKMFRVVAILAQLRARGLELTLPRAEEGREESDGRSTAASTSSLYSFLKRGRTATQEAQPGSPHPPKLQLKRKGEGKPADASLLEVQRAESLDQCCGGAASMPTTPPTVPPASAVPGAPSQQVGAATGNTPGAGQEQPAEPSTQPKWSGGKPNWWYKSDFACTVADGDSGPKKCPPGAAWPADACNNPPPTYCTESDKIACPAMAAATMKDKEGALGGFGFMCPHLMLGSAELLAAAKEDGLDPDKHAYGVATFDKLQCGQCVKLENAEEKLKYAPTLTVQIFNSVANVVDVYMAGGGYGVWNGCSKTNKLYPKPNTAYFYEEHVNTERFKKHLQDSPDAAKISADFSQLDLDDAIKNQGGIRGGRSYSECLKKCTQKIEQCRAQCQPEGSGCTGTKNGGVCIMDKESCEFAFKGHNTYTTKKAVESCKWAFDHDVHWNRKLKLTVVECPKALTARTGLIPKDPKQGKSAGFKHDIGWSIPTSQTTMEDCSRPTCSSANLGYSKAGKWEDGHDAMYTCNAVGEKLVDEPKDPCQK
mmetsp:Transcript_23967/g.60447  ORF Transcript_23967/g.60447 Transcript_23967/m.60447 type:complete len:537 (+) Transcript_23967:153-1763(+)